MKKIAIILCTLFISLWIIKAEAQVQYSILSESFFSEGNQLWLSQPGTWVGMPGADTNAVNTGVSGEKWRPVDIRLIREEKPPYWEGIGWFKTTILVDSSMYGHDVTIFGFTRGAAKIYLDSVLIRTEGKIGSDAESEVARGFMKPITIKLGSDERQEIFIKFSNYEMKSLWQTDFCGINLFLSTPDLAMSSFENRLGEKSREDNRFTFILGFMVALAMFHLLLFFYYPAEKANLTCALLFIAISGIFLSGIMFDWGVSVKELFRYSFGESFSLISAGIILPFFIYQILDRKYNWLPFTLLSIGLVLIVILFFNLMSVKAFSFLFFLISMILGVALVTHARFRIKKKELNIVLLFYILALILLLPGLMAASLGYDFLWGSEPFYMNLTAPVGAAGYSFYLARGVAVTNRRLKKELVENDRLTAEKLQVEQDKQILIEKQKELLEEEVALRTLELRNSLASLKATQNQLIQKEKLASLGELTAGIAHEIQNPLNFVNNFSELSKELLDEMNEELANGNLDDVKEIAADVISNLEKINHHGKRADDIVKGMLQHSRSSTGTKEPTDINALADEYLRLAYHGLRAKDKSFNADMKTTFDESLAADEAGLGKIDVIPQDIGRVLLNLFNNAFYAVNERVKDLPGLPNKREIRDENLAGLDRFNPTVSVSTKSVSSPLTPKGESDSGKVDYIEIRITDNGNGIPESVKEKVFQPFFTTKPTGQGTGLGLSLSYDIVKAHGGELEVETAENEGTTFIIKLPIELKPL